LEVQQKSSSAVMLNY